MAQFWIAVFFILLAIAQVVRSIKEIALPFPAYLVLGMVLAIAANPGSRFAFIPSQQVTLQEIKVPDPAIAAPDLPLIAAIDTQNLAPVALDAIEPKPKRTRKTAPKSLPSTPDPDALGSIDKSEPKPKRTRKATAKFSQV